MTTTTRDPHPAFHFLTHSGPLEGAITFGDMRFEVPIPDFPLREPALRPYAEVVRITRDPNFLWADPKSLGRLAQAYFGGNDDSQKPWPVKNATAEAWESAVAALPACVAERLWRGINRFAVRFDAIEAKQEVIQTGN